MSSEELIARFIEPDRFHPGPGDVIIANYGVPVWALISYLKASDGDVRRVAEDYDLPLEAVEAALAYYEQYSREIDARLAASVA